MHLFLTSSPCIPPHQGLELPFVLNPANGFLSRLTACTKGTSHLMIAAYPESHEHNDQMAKDFALAFRHAHLGNGSMRMLDGRNMKDASRLIADADLIILAGGHVPTQNRFFHALNLRSLLKGFPGVIMGISAGSMNMAKVVYAQPEEPGESTDPAYVRFPEGLGLTDVQILPHLNQVRENILDGKRLFEDITFPDSRGRHFLAIPDGSYVYETDGNPMLCGSGYVVQDGHMDPLGQDETSIPLHFT